nr:hypothetical protein CFP56_78827 [Quercus suber]
MEGSSDEETDRRRPDKIDRLEAQLKALTDMVASLMADRTAQNPAPVQQPAATAQPAQLPQHVQPVPPAQDASQANSNPTVPSKNPVLITVADTQERTHEQDRAKNNVEDSKVASKLESPEEKLRTLRGIDSYALQTWSLLEIEWKRCTEIRPLDGCSSLAIPFGAAWGRNQSQEGDSQEARSRLERSADDRSLSLQHLIGKE